jgi:hypothetical protein
MGRPLCIRALLTDAQLSQIQTPLLGIIRRATTVSEYRSRSLENRHSKDTNKSPAGRGQAGLYAGFRILVAGARFELTTFRL